MDKIVLSFRDIEARIKAKDMELDKKYYIKGNNFTVDFIYYDPLVSSDQSRTVKVSGNIKTKNESETKSSKFSGMLIEIGGAWKSQANILLQNFDEANQNLGNPVQDVNKVIEQIISEVPYNAIAEALGQRAGHTERMKALERERKRKKQLNNSKNFSPEQYVEVMVDYMPPELLEELKNEVNKKEFNILQEPYGVVHSQDKDIVVVVFRNKTFFRIPSKYLVKKEKEENSMDKKMQMAFREYVDMRSSGDKIDDAFKVSMIQYQLSKGRKYEQLKSDEKEIYNKYHLDRN